jgi:spoIIIJ-associated protein
LGLGQAPTVIRARIKEGHAAPARPAPEVKEARVEDETLFEEAVGQMEEALVEPESRKEAPPVEAGPFADAVVRIVEDVVKAMEIDARPVVKADGREETVVDIVGSDVAILIGTRGQTLDALQYLVSIAANKGRSDKRRVILDAEGYRQRQKEMLERRAREYARAVKEQGQEAVLEPQPARDRRIIHVALADDKDVYTYSEGVGDDRHVVISPKK